MVINLLCLLLVLFLTSACQTPGIAYSSASPGMVRTLTGHWLMSANGVHFWDWGSAWDPTANPKRQLYAGMVNEGAARASWAVLDANARAEWNDPHHNDWIWGYLFAAGADTQRQWDFTRWLP